MSQTTEHKIWAGIMARCTTVGSKYYPRYGGRGIEVCDRWKIFENFFADMGVRPGPKYTIDRIDNDGPYSPDNCRWATWRQQATNKRTNHLVTIDGLALTVTEWAERRGLKPATVFTRLRKGWTPELALTPGSFRKVKSLHTGKTGVGQLQLETTTP